MTLAEADARARLHATYWAALATALAGWALARTSAIALCYGALADVAALRALAVIYRARGSAQVVVLALAASLARLYVVQHPLELPWQAAFGVTALAHAALAVAGALAMCAAHRY